jgi:hypothetical protein
VLFLPPRIASATFKKQRLSDYEMRIGIST